MTQPIEPALSPDEWENPADVGYFDWDSGIVDVSADAFRPAKLPAKLIALANAALPDSDPRKITRETVRRLSALAGHLENVNDMSQEIGDGYAPDVWQSAEMEQGITLLRAIADALESYLPPET